MLLARLELRAPGLRSLLLAAPRSSFDLAPLSEKLYAAAIQAGLQAHLLRVPDVELGAPSSVGETMAAEDVATPATARRRLATSDGLTIVLGRGILDSPGTLITASVVDGVVLAARLRRTSRKDLSDAGGEIERSGGRLVGAVLVG